MKKLLYLLLFVHVALFGQENYSLSFDGVDDYIIVDNPIYSVDQFTVSCWVKFPEQIGNGNFIGNWPQNNNNRSFLLYFNTVMDANNPSGDHSISALVRKGQEYIYLDYILQPEDFNVWNYISLSYDGFNSELYFNGILRDSSISQYGNIEGSAILTFGTEENYDFGQTHPGVGSPYYNGLMNEISIWNKSLSSQEIIHFMNCADLESEDGLVGYWNFNEGSGDTVYNLSENANNGIIYGATHSDDIPEQNCIEGCTDLLATNFNSLAMLDDGSCISQEEYTIDSLNNIIEQATTSLSSLQQALDTWNTTIDLSTGWNIIGYGCPSSINVTEGLSNHTESIIITKANNGNVYMPEFGFNGIGDFTPGFGYQIKLTEAIEGFSLCDWYVNDIPEDNIVSLQDSLELINSLIGCTDSFACNYEINKIYDDNSCEYPQEGFDCNGNFTAQIGDKIYGGIVFYVNENEQRGLIASMQDLDNSYPWGCINYYLNDYNFDYRELGYGLQNTIDIESNCLESVSSAGIVLDMNIASNSNWFIPSLNELILMFENVGGNSEFADQLNFEEAGYYWSSSENYYDLAMGVYYFHPLPEDNNYRDYSETLPKSQSYKIRPISSFGNWIFGCMDLSACNYSSTANMADSSCYNNDIGCGCDVPGVSPGYDCNGNCINDSDGDSVCDEFEIIGCQDVDATNYNAEATDAGYCDGDFITQIGELYQGGILFHYEESDTGVFGLIAAIEDLQGDGFAWGCHGTNINGSNNSEIGFGSINTQNIIDQCGETNNAAFLSSQFENFGYTDWYLPSVNELTIMHNTIGNGSSDNIGSISGNYYWSSTQSSGNSNNCALDIRMSDGFVRTNCYKWLDNNSVRPVRSFYIE